ncbi:MAG: hypothetical protein M3321_01340 [Actinomycetota bacterium]|nr:hypothetical protein [Actinomycetota bacterium]
MKALKIFGAVVAALILFSVAGLVVALSATRGESQIRIHTVIAETTR